MFVWKILNKKNIPLGKNNNNKILRMILSNRGISKKKDIENFLNPIKPQDLKLKDISLKSKNIDKSIKRIILAKENKESVVVYTDYDADGVCGGTIVWEFLYQIGLKIMPYIPHRMEEGYGLSQKGIDKIKKEYNPSLIITVDHGISAPEMIKYAQKLGMDVIVIDHHVKNREIPAQSVIHTTALCATGVAWIFIRELAKKLKIKSSKVDSYLDLVSLATVADLVPLLGPNRSFVKFGLESLNKTKRIGLIALIKSAGLQKGSLGVYEVGHILVPRINAMGRLLHALDALRLLCTKDSDRAYNLAGILNITNTNRQTLTQETILHAKSLYEKGKTSKKLIFIAHESYNQGIIGLVAGRLAEEFSRPSIVVSKGKIFSKASARSVSGFNIIETIRKASEFLIDSGGHPMAAGFTVRTEYLLKLQKKLEEIAETDLSDEQMTKSIKIDSKLDLSDINWKLYQHLKMLAPFGMANPEPVFMSQDIIIEDLRLVGKAGNHLKMKLTDGNGSDFSAIAFGLGDFYKKLAINKKISVAYTVAEDKWGNDNDLQLKVRDVKISDIN